MKLKLVDNRGLNDYLWDNSLLDVFFEEGRQTDSWFNETNDEYELTLNLAGFKKKEIKLSAEG